MKETQTAFQIEAADNVATALEEIISGTVSIAGEASGEEIEAITRIPKGHKIALREIEVGEEVIKYGVCIGQACEHIKAGSWVHLHNIRSMYDERSSHLDVVTGTPNDMMYE